MPPDLPASYAHGVRRSYRDLPLEVRSWIADQLGAPVVQVRDRVGGFAPGCAAVVSTHERSAFVKAASSVPNPVSLELYRGEWARLRALPEHASLPRLLAAAQLELPEEVSAVTLLPALPGEPPPHPWTEPTARLVFDRLGELGTALAASVETTSSTLPGSEHLLGFFGSWSEVAADPEDPWRYDPWVSTDLGRLHEADRTLQTAVVGSVPAHTDLRADNVLVGRPAAPGAERDVWFVDWAAAVTAASWVDPAILACDLVTSRADRSQGGTMDVAGFLASHPVTAAVAPALRWSMMVALAATLHRFSRTPDPPGLPTIRRWQHRCAEDLLAFVRNADLGSARPLW